MHQDQLRTYLPRIACFVGVGLFLCYSTGLAVLSPALTLLIQMRASGLSAPAVASTSAPATPVAVPLAPLAPSVGPTGTPAAFAHIEPETEYEASAFVALPHPRSRQRQTVFGQLTKDGKGVAGAQMYCVVHYRTTDSRWPEEGANVTDENGRASVGFGIGSATAGYTVSVDVYFVHEGQTYHTVTSFTPQY